jgi:hypothetical protein
MVHRRKRDRLSLQFVAIVSPFEHWILIRRVQALHPYKVSEQRIHASSLTSGFL